MTLSCNPYKEYRASPRLKLFAALALHTVRVYLLNYNFDLIYFAAFTWSHASDSDLGSPGTTPGTVGDPSPSSRRSSRAPGTRSDDLFGTALHYSRRSRSRSPGSAVSQATSGGGSHVRRPVLGATVHRMPLVREPPEWHGGKVSSVRFWALLWESLMER